MADVTDATFDAQVVQRSQSVPVVVDLWASWCGPCTTLGPILEKVIGETKGLVELAKVDVEANKEVAGAFQVQSIPAVYAMYQGQIIDGFVGALSETEVVAFVQRVIDASNGTATVADATTDGSATSEDVPDAEVVAAPAAPAPAPATPTMSEPGADVIPQTPPPSAQEAEAIEAELNQLLVTVKGDDAARERYIELLNKLGADDPRTNAYRRKLTTALY